MKTSMSNLSESNLPCLGVKIPTAVLNTHSEAQLDAEMHKYFRAHWERSGRVPEFNFHHSRGLLSPLISAILA